MHSRPAPRPIQNDRHRTIQTPEHGLYALLAAVIDLARRDAQLDPASFSDPTDRRRARRNRCTALAFLADLGLAPAAAGDD